MGCAIVSPDGQILSVGIDQPIWEPNVKNLSSDVHAEVHAMGICARQGIATGGCTAYITMPPCLKCFMVLAMSGIRRIVTRKAPCEQDARKIQPASRRLQIPLVIISDSEERRTHIDRLAAKCKWEPDERGS